MTLASTSSGSTPPEYWWVLPLIAFLTLAFGTGGFAAYRRLNLDRKLGVAAQETNDEVALSARWEKIIEAQTASLVEPLRSRLREVGDEVHELEVTQKRMEADMATQRQKYWRAIQYIRTLLTWMRARASGADHEPPAPPAEIAGDI